MAKKSKFQKFETETINRSEIKGAEYNPRVITEDAKKRLRKMLAKHGLVQPLVWNRRTGNLVAGHQRLEALDSLERSLDYALEVAIVDVSEREERILNVQLNNPSMQGEWDIDKLLSLSGTAFISPEDMGFSEGDAAVLFGDLGNSDLHEIIEDDVEVSNAKERIREIKAKRKSGDTNMKSEGKADFYFTVVCESEDQKKAILKKLAVPDWECFVNGRSLATKLGV